MKTAQIFTGKKIETVQVGSEFTMEGKWDWPVGRAVRFQLKAGVEVEAVVKETDGFGSKMLVTKIINDGKVEAELVKEFETEPVEEAVEEPVKDEAVTEFATEYKLLIDKNKFTKKEVVSFIEAHDIDVNTSMSKANLIKELESRGVVEYK